MESLFSFESQLYTERVSKASLQLSDELAIFTENTSDLMYIQEKEVELMSSKFRKFLTEIIESLKSFYNNMKISITSGARSAKFQKALRRLREEIKEKKANGVKNVEVVDIWTLEETYLDYTVKIKKLTEKVFKKEYKTTMEMNNDIAEIEQLFAEADDKLDKLSKVKKTVDLGKLEVFVEYEISGRSKVLASLNECITMMEQMKSNIRMLEMEEKIRGAEILTRRVGLLKKTSLKISGFFHKWVVKIITVFVFIFA